MHDPPIPPAAMERALDELTRDLRAEAERVTRALDAPPPDLDEVPPVVVDKEAGK